MIVRDYVKNLNQKGKNLIPQELNNFEFLEEYFSRPLVYDSMCILTYKTLPCADEDIDLLQTITTGIIYSNAYKYDTLFKTTQFEYNPIWNVDGTTTYVYGEKEKEYGERNKILNNGEKISTNSNGERITTNVNGEKSTTNINGAREDVNDFYAVPYGEETENNTGKSTSNIGTSTDTSTLNSYTDTSTLSAHTDRSTHSASVDSEKELTHTDKEKTYTDTETKQGNQGVTSTQSLINQERQVAYFNMVKVIIDDIIDGITIPYWNENI